MRRNVADRLKKLEDRLASIEEERRRLKEEIRLLRTSEPSPAEIPAEAPILLGRSTCAQAPQTSAEKIDLFLTLFRCCESFNEYANSTAK